MFKGSVSLTYVLIYSMFYGALIRTQCWEAIFFVTYIAQIEPNKGILAYLTFGIETCPYPTLSHD